VVAPEWVQALAPAAWYGRYGSRVEKDALPKGDAARTVLGEPIGTDGHALLAAVYEPAAPAWLREVPAVEMRRQAWIHQFFFEDDVVRWRKAADLPPLRTRFDSPYDGVVSPNPRNFGYPIKSTTYAQHQGHFWQKHEM